MPRCNSFALLLRHGLHPVPKSRAQIQPLLLARSSKGIASSAFASEESLSSYDPTSYYPVKIGDSILGSYSVKLKLGYGRTSTTWLCRNQSNAFKVLKITTNNATLHEEQVHRHLEECSRKTEQVGSYCVRRVEDIFSLDSKNGQHKCFVFDPLGASLLEFVDRPDTKLQPHHVCYIATYLLHGLSFLHENNVVHTDIKLDNIQLTLPENEDEFLSALVSSEENDPSLIKLDGTGGTIYQSRVMPQNTLGFPILCDFGSAIILERPRRSFIQALPYRAPEVILGAEWDAKVDIWNLGVIIWELLCDERLFGQTSELDSIKLMVEYLGNPPPGFVERCARGTPFIDEQGHFRDMQISRTRLIDRVECTTPMPLLFDFMESVLRWDPRERLSASELLEHPWIREQFAKDT